MTKEQEQVARVHQNRTRGQWERTRGQRKRTRGQQNIKWGQQSKKEDSKTQDKRMKARGQQNTRGQQEKKRTRLLRMPDDEEEVPYDTVPVTMNRVQFLRAYSTINLTLLCR